MPAGGLHLVTSVLTPTSSAERNEAVQFLFPAAADLEDGSGLKLVSCSRSTTPFSGHHDGGSSSRHHSTTSFARYAGQPVIFPGSTKDTQKSLQEGGLGTDSAEQTHESVGPGSENGATQNVGDMPGEPDRAQREHGYDDPNPLDAQKAEREVQEQASEADRAVGEAEDADMQRRGTALEHEDERQAATDEARGGSTNRRQNVQAEEGKERGGGKGRKNGGDDEGGAGGDTSMGGPGGEDDDAADQEELQKKMPSEEDDMRGEEASEEAEAEQEKNRNVMEPEKEEDDGPKAKAPGPAVHTEAEAQQAANEIMAEAMKDPKKMAKLQQGGNPMDNFTVGCCGCELNLLEFTGMA